MIFRLWKKFIFMKPSEYQIFCLMLAQIVPARFFFVMCHLLSTQGRYIFFKVFITSLFLMGMLCKYKYDIYMPVHFIDILL